MASKKQVVPMEGGGSTTTTTNPPKDWTPTEDTTGKTSSATFDAYMQSKFDEAYAELKKMGLQKRLETLKFLRSKGVGSESDVSFTGLELADVARYREILVYVDSVKGMTLPKAMDNLADLKNAAISDSARRKTNIKDLDSVFTDVVVNMVGRQPTKTELEKFRAAYSGMESGDNAPTVQGAAEAQVKQTMPDETKAAQFSQYATMFEQMLRGG